MKIISKIVNKFGADKLLHFIVAMNLILIGGLFGDLGIGIAWLITAPLIILKECLDAREEGNKWDGGDFAWGISGGIVGTIIYVITLLY